MFSSIDGAIDKFKKQPVNPEMQQAMPLHPQAAYPYPVAGATAAAYPDPSYQAAPGGAQYAGAPYDANAYAGGQYAAYPQQYQQSYGAAAANGSAAAQPGVCALGFCVQQLFPIAVHRHHFTIVNCIGALISLCAETVMLLLLSL